MSGVPQGKQPLIFFSASVRDAERPHKVELLGELLKYPIYHSKYEYKEWSEHLFKANQVRAIISTGGFGTGINLPNVVLTLHLSSLFDLCDFRQETGRVGRGGEKVQAIAYVSDNDRKFFKQAVHSKAHFSTDSSKCCAWWKDEDKRALARFIDTESCRRLVMDAHLDGSARGTCTLRQLPRSTWCRVQELPLGVAVPFSSGA
jgi:superfamily II DNA helicase RecQ